MGDVRFSRRAEADLLEIGSYTLREWGSKQTARYLRDLQRCTALLASNPRLGRACDEVRPGLMRFEKGLHVFFYRMSPEGIIVSRVLHREMLPWRHTFEDIPTED